MMAKSIFLTMFDSDGLLELLRFGASEHAAEAATAKAEWVEIRDYGCLYITRSLNFIGDTCLRTNMVTKPALAEVSCGDIIEIITDNLSSIETIQFMTPNYSGVHLFTCQTAKCWKIYVQKDPALSPK